MTTPGSLPVVRGFLERVLPGSSRAARQLRGRVMEFAFDPLAKTLQIAGPIGAGKSTLARTVSMVKRIAPLTQEQAALYATTVKFDGAGRIDPKFMPWYVELALTGLAENLAEAQLFGTVKGAFTGAIDRPGIFEQAVTGRMRRERPDEGAVLTGGVVFLDEIGDLSKAHQAKLLPILSGGVFYRLGDEGQQTKELQYTGVTIVASWHALQEVLRPDLYSRLSANKIRVPSLSERMEDFDEIVRGLEQMIIEAAKKEIERMIRADQVNLDRAHWRTRQEQLGTLSSEDRRLLSATDWNERGNMRGLTDAIQRILVGGKSAKEVLEEPPYIVDRHRAATPTLFDRLLQRRADGTGLAGHLRAIEVEQRRELREHLRVNYDARQRLADALNINKDTIAQQLQQVDRRRTRTRRKEEK